VAGRRSVWSSEDIIAASGAFVAVTDEVWRLQRGTDAECKHFQRMANQGHYQAEGGTRQGIYVMTASGKLLASVNTLDAAAVLGTIRKGLTAWEQTTEADRRLPEDFQLPRRRWESSYPADGLVLRSLNVDLGEGVDKARRNRDHVWFSKDEARGWLGADLTKGARHDVSKLITDRLTSFHLVDNIRGQTIPFAPEETRGSTLQTHITEVAGDLVRFRLTGRTKAETDGTWKLGKSDWTPTELYPRALETEVLGFGEYDQGTQRFSKLEFVAVGTRTGRTNLNGRAKDDVGPAGIGFFFEIAPDKAAARVPPAYIDIYGADWIVDPR
jgi:hypothetical protein